MIRVRLSIPLPAPYLTPPAAFARLKDAAGQAKSSLTSVPCRSGGIGRRAWFRSMYSQGCGGSSPFFGTKINYKAFKIKYLIHPRHPKNERFLS